jgi:branched-subunit amino acid aminotransferase/4-amino-4-deoxychorismate lyase
LAEIAWIDGPDGGRWGSAAVLSLPLADRGLTLADGLFETVLVEAGRPRLLAEHVARWHEGASLLGMPPPAPLDRVAALAAEAVGRSGIGGGALRLNWSRGEPAGGARGIDLPPPGAPAPQPRCWLQLTAAAPCFAPLRTIVSRTERRNASSLLSRCKTFAYGSAIQARREARAAGADDALLLSTAGGLCCGTTATLLLRRQGGWLTPALASGCLPGVMRGRALASGRARELEGPLEPDDLDGPVLLLNSLGCRPVIELDGRPLPPAPDPEGLFRDLLGVV